MRVLIYTKCQTINDLYGYSVCINVHGFTPLHAAADEDHETMARLLVDAGADMTMRCTIGETALQLAARKHNNNKVWKVLTKAEEIFAQSAVGTKRRADDPPPQETSSDSRKKK